MDKPLGFYESTLGKKMLQINKYAHLLHASAAFLWFARSVILFCVGVHIVAAFQVWWRSKQARPIGYKVYNPPAVDYAAKTMVWSGPIIAAFIVYHLLHFTVGTINHAEFIDLEPYNNVIKGFQHTPVAVAYIIALLMLGFHLYHGLWSLFQSLGLDHPKFGPYRRPLAIVLTVVIIGGFISVPLSVIAGILH